MDPDEQHYRISETGALINIPSPTSSKEDFDFYGGNWEIQNKQLKTRLNNCTEWIEFEAKQEMKMVLNGFIGLISVKLEF